MASRNPRRDPRAALPALLRAAARVRGNAHAPYSNFPVGAAVLAGGQIFVGVNVENSAYPLGVCAERSAVSAAVSAGHTRIDAVAVVGGSLRPVPPCGGCRQVLAEFCASEVPLVYSTPGGRKVVSSIGELLPSAFGIDDLRIEEQVKPGAATPPVRAVAKGRRG
jgi:cytidine deaminase